MDLLGGHESVLDRAHDGVLGLRGRRQAEGGGVPEREVKPRGRGSLVFESGSPSRLACSSPSTKILILFFGREARAELHLHPVRLRGLVRHRRHRLRRRRRRVLRLALHDHDLVHLRWQCHDIILMMRYAPFVSLARAPGGPSVAPKSTGGSPSLSPFLSPSTRARLHYRPLFTCCAVRLPRVASWCRCVEVVPPAVSAFSLAVGGGGSMMLRQHTDSASLCKKIAKKIGSWREFLGRKFNQRKLGDTTCYFKFDI